MSIIEVGDLTFVYDGACESVFEHLDLRLDTDWRRTEDWSEAVERSKRGSRTGLRPSGFCGAAGRACRTYRTQRLWEVQRA